MKTLDMTPAELVAFWSLEHEQATIAYDQTRLGTVANVLAWNRRAKALSRLLAAQDAAADPQTRALLAWDQANSGAHFYGQY